MTTTAELVSGVVTNRVKPLVRWGLTHAVPSRVLKDGADKGDLQARLTVEAQNLSPEEIAELFSQIRAQGPLVRSKFSYVSVDHAVVKEVLSSTQFRTGFPGDDRPAISRLVQWARREGLHPVEPPSMLVTDGDDHTRYRKLVSRVFTARAVEGLRERTEAIAADLLDELAARGGPVDLVAAYCEKLPVAVISEILGVPESERANVLRMGGHAAASLDLGIDWSTFRTVDGALDEFDEWLGKHFDHLRANPGDDLFSTLLHATDDEGRLSERELKATAGLVLAAGFETTVNLLSNAIRLLVEHPEQLAGLRADPSGWGNAVDEALRYDPPVLLTGRSAAEDTEVAGQRVGEGWMTTLVLAGANRDPQVFDNPDAFDVARENARDHLSFSAGRHFCLGAALARMEGEVGLRAFFDRFDVELLPGAGRRPTRILRGYETLPARLVQRSN